MLSVNKMVAIVSICLMPCLCNATDTALNNETAITFVAENGKSTSAYQGTFQVPENRAVNNSRQLTLHYVRFPSTSKKPAAPIVYLAGGPGGSGISTAKGRRYDLFMALRQHADVIAFDQRGTGLSEQVAPCKSSQIMQTDALWNEQKLTALHQAALTECMATWQANRVDINGYTSVQNAYDLNDLRILLKAEKISLWGISYGSHLALASIKLFPSHLDKVILASAEGLDQTVKLPQYTDAYFASLQKVVDQQPQLKTRYPDIVGMMHRVFKQLELQPIKLTLAINQQQATDFLFQKIHLQILSSMMIADPNRYVGMLLELFRDLDNNQTNMVQFALKQGFFSNKPIEMRIMPTAMDLASGISPQRLQQYQQQAGNALIGGMLNFPMPQLAGYVPTLDLGESYRKPFQANIPTLLLSGTLDGRTYLPEQLEAVAGLTPLSQVTIQHAGHNLLMASPEVATTILDFLAKGKTDKKLISLPAPNFAAE